MKIFILSLLFILLSPYFSYSQDAGDTKYVYADLANVRIEPNTNSEIVSKLKAGHEVTIEHIAENSRSSINGIDGNWYKITYTYNGESKIGFIWGNTLSHTQLRRGDTKFVFGVEHLDNKENSHKAIASIKAIQNNHIISRETFTLDQSSRSIIQGKIRDNGGLSDIEYILTLEFSGESCGIPYYEFNYGWNGEKLLKLPYTVSSGDGAYSDSQILIFPSQGAFQNTILKIGTISEAINDDFSDYETKYGTLSIYKWNGENIILKETKE